MWLQQSDPMFNMGVDVMRPAFNFKPKYRVTMLIREEWTRELIWFRDGPGWRGPGLESMDNLLEEASVFL